MAPGAPALVMPCEERVLPTRGHVGGYDEPEVLPREIMLT